MILPVVPMISTTSVSSAGIILHVAPMISTTSVSSQGMTLANFQIDSKSLVFQLSFQEMRSQQWISAGPHVISCALSNDFLNSSNENGRLYSSKFFDLKCYFFFFSFCVLICFTGNRIENTGKGYPYMREMILLHALQFVF